MKTFLTLALSAVIATTAVSAFAHDPSQHRKQGDQAPDCSSMRNMDMSKMDMNDPVMKAMHDKCMGHMDGQSGGAGSHDHSAGQDGHGDGTAAPGHQHDKGDE